MAALATGNAFAAGSRLFHPGRVQRAAYLRILSGATQLAVGALELILEFGGGSCEMVPIVRALDFRAVYAVYDLPPMLLLQRYLQRYAGYSAQLIGHDVSSLGSGSLRAAAKCDKTVTIESSSHGVNASAMWARHFAEATR